MNDSSWILWRQGLFLAARSRDGVRIGTLDCDRLPLAVGKPRQAVSAGKLRAWAAERAGLPLWLVDESVDVVGDSAETIALILPDTAGTSSEPLHEWVEQRLLPLLDMEEADRRLAVERAWDQLGGFERFVWNKLILGGFRVGVSQLLVVRALAQVSELPNEVIAHRLMGDWSPTPEFYHN